MANQNRLFGRSLLCQSITKFSQSTVPRGAKISGWNHLEAQDLCLLIEYLQDENDIQLRVIQGTRDLEVLPLTALIHETRDLHQRYQSLSPDDLPIFGLTKANLLAIRYFCQGNQVRRIQVRFPDESTCDDSVQLLNRHGLMFSSPTTKQSGSSSQFRPGTAESYASHIHDATPTHGAQTKQSATNVPSVHDLYNYRSNAGHNTERTYSLNQTTSSFSGFATSPCPPAQNTHRQPSFAPIRTSMESDRRPATADNINWPSDMTRDLLPPRRELPFPRPSTASSTSSRTLPPLPKPKYASDTTSKVPLTQEQQSPQRKQLSRLATPRGPTKFEPPASRMYNFLQQKSIATEQEERPTGYHHDAMQLDEVEFRAPSSHSRPSSGTLYSPGHPLQSSSPQRAGQSEQHPSSSPQPFPPSPQMSSPQHTSPNQHISDPQFPNNAYTSIPSEQQSREELRNFTAQSQESRQKEINRFIMDNINNDDFLALCVEMEACWRRTVLDRRD